MEMIIKLTNRVALFSILLLVYWVFIFISITVFDFKVFRENLTEIFFLSILGVLALMSGSLVVNIMFNLTKISNAVGDRYGSNELKPFSYTNKYWISLLILFPLLFGFLYVADWSSTNRREKLILESAQQLVLENENTMREFSEYSFDRKFINKVTNSLELLGKIDERFPSINLIARDVADKKNVYLKFDSYDYISDKDKAIRKVHYIFSTSKEEREYLRSVFEEKTGDYQFSAHNGFYELYYPVKINSKIIVLYLTDRQSYGKIGS